MKSISSALKTALTSGDVAMLYRLVAQDGTVIALTDCDTALLVDGITYQPGPGLERILMKVTNNAEVSNQTLAATVIEIDDDELRGGKWDSATLSVSWCSWANPELGSVNIFYGKIGAIQWTDNGFRADIQNYLKDLQRNIGDVVTAGCRHDLFSVDSPGSMGSCRAVKSDYTAPGVVGVVLTEKLKFKTTTGLPDGWSTNGQLTFTSGVNMGLTYQIKVHEVSTNENIGESFELFLPTVAKFQTGDTFIIYAGCDKTLATCKAKFDNVVNFGGFPHIRVGINASFENG